MVEWGQTSNSTGLEASEVESLGVFSFPKKKKMDTSVQF